MDLIYQVGLNSLLASNRKGLGVVGERLVILTPYMSINISFLETMFLIDNI